MAKKEFTYRGKKLEELQKLRIEEVEFYNKHLVNCTCYRNNTPVRISSHFRTKEFNDFISNYRGGLHCIDTDTFKPDVKLKSHINFSHSSFDYLTPDDISVIIDNEKVKVINNTDKGNEVIASYYTTSEPLFLRFSIK